MDNIVTFFLGVLTGTLTGTLPEVIYGWFMNRKERKTLRLSLMLEIIYMHKANLYLLLDKYTDDQSRQVIDENSFSMPHFSTTIYDAHVGKIDQLFSSGIALQVHYHYRNINRLNTMRQNSKGEIDKEFSDYLDQAIHTYEILLGTLNFLSEKPGTNQIIKDNVRALIDYEFGSSSDEELLRKYKRTGAAD